MTKAATQVTGIISMASDFGINLEGTVMSDSNAAIGITHRTGLGGRCRHIKVQYLWIQEKVKSGELKLKKVIGTENSADLMTKAVGGETLDGHLQRMGFYPRGGRAEKAAQLNVIKIIQKTEEVTRKGKTKEDKNADKRIKMSRGQEWENIMTPQCVRVHDEHGRQMKGKRWVTGLTRSLKIRRIMRWRSVRVACTAQEVS
jgi:hypothetical protein